MTLRLGSRADDDGERGSLHITVAPNLMVKTAADGRSVSELWQQNPGLANNPHGKTGSQKRPFYELRKLTQKSKPKIKNDRKNQRGLQDSGRTRGCLRFSSEAGKLAQYANSESVIDSRLLHNSIQNR
jgi:hypothetical protein